MVEAPPHQAKKGSHIVAPSVFLFTEQGIQELHNVLNSGSFHNRPGLDGVPQSSRTHKNDFGILAYQELESLRHLPHI